MLDVESVDIVTLFKILEALCALFFQWSWNLVLLYTLSRLIPKFWEFEASIREFMAALLALLSLLYYVYQIVSKPCGFEHIFAIM